MKIRFDQLPEKEKSLILQDLFNKTTIPAHAIEKDWWVVQTLSLIFELDVAKHLVFKGGTSLSKAWKIIDRFSEDIDLAIDREFLGFKGDLTKKQRTELRKKAGNYTSDIFYNKLKAKFAEKGFSNVQLKLVETTESDQDPRIIEVYYPYVADYTAYIAPKVQVEIGCRSLREPFSIQEFGSLIDENYPNQPFTSASIKVPTVNPERTFLEKIFLLHEEFQRPEEKIRVNRLSRHLYDVVKLSKTQFAEKALQNKELYTTIIEHRSKFTRVGGVDYKLHHPKHINPIPTEKYIDAWRKDYKSMLDQMIHEENAPSFDEIIEELKILKSKINSLGWRFDKEF